LDYLNGWLFGVGANRIKYDDEVFNGVVHDINRRSAILSAGMIEFSARKLLAAKYDAEINFLRRWRRSLTVTKALF